MRYLSFLVIWLILNACNHGSSREKQYPDNSGAQSQLSELFREGQHTTRLVTIKQLTEAQRQILRKFLRIEMTDSTVRHAFDSLLKNARSIEPRRLSKRFGLSDGELDLLLSVFTSRQTASERDTLSIFNDGNRIRFTGSGRLSTLDSLVINAKDISATFNQSLLVAQKFDGSHLPNEFLPPGEGLNTLYVFSGPTGIAGATTTKYSLLVARLAKSGTTYMFLNTEGAGDVKNPLSQFYSIIVDYGHG